MMLWQTILLGYLSVGVILSCYVFFTLSQFSEGFLKNNKEYLESDDIENYLKAKESFDTGNKYLIFLYYTLVSPLYILYLGVSVVIKTFRGK